MRFKRFEKLEPSDLQVIREVRNLENEGYNIVEVKPIYKKVFLGKQILSTIIFYELHNKEW